tara:strand:- start:572 stop:1027 length:456 start_codon:yes stop_codon:yes gene_type:complete
MVKIDKTDIANINFLKKELKLRKITTVKIKKGNYEIELASENIDYKQKILQNLSQDEVNLDSKRNIKQDNQIKSENIVKSPMVGVAYLSSDPSAPQYVKEGQHVKQGEILLLIEAMKTFNEIKAPKSGIIKKIEILNSQPVEFGDTLVIFE